MQRNKALQQAYLQDKIAIFRADASHGIPSMVGNLYDGNVIAVYEEKQEVLVCFMCGLRSLTDAIKFANLVAIVDIDLGTQMEIENYSGLFVDLRIPAPA